MRLQLLMMTPISADDNDEAMSAGRRTGRLYAVHKFVCDVRPDSRRVRPAGRPRVEMGRRRENARPSADKMHYYSSPAHL